MAPAEESYEFDAPRWAELGAEAQTLASPSVKPWFGASPLPLLPLRTGANAHASALAL